MGKFVISMRFNGEYQFNLKASNGQIILVSEGYITKTSCMEGIKAVKQSIEIGDFFEKKISKNGKYYFNIKASNGSVLGTSELYESLNARDNGIQSVKMIAPNASIVDFTS